VSSRRSEHFAAVPWRFLESWRSGELGGLHVLVALHLVARCHEARNTAAGVAFVTLRELADLCEVGDEAVRRKLHDLRETNWVDFEPSRPPRSTWRIWLTGLDLREAGDLRGDLRVTSWGEAPERPLMTSDLPGEAGGNPGENGDRVASEWPPLARVRVDETRRDERNPR
jgi:hypothetical protein